MTTEVTGVRRRGERVDMKPFVVRRSEDILENDFVNWRNVHMFLDTKKKKSLSDFPNKQTRNQKALYNSVYIP